MIRVVALASILVMVTGCATHHQANTALGGIAGGVVGHSIGGQSGAVVGSVIGAAIGSNHPPPPNYHPSPPHTSYHRYEIIHPDYSPCSQWNYQAREHCYRGAEARAREEQSRRNREAYNAGRYGR